VILSQDEARGFGPRHIRIMEEHGPPGRMWHTVQLITARFQQVLYGAMI